MNGLPQIIFTKDVRICTGIFWYSIKAGTVAQCVRMFALNAAQVTCKNNCGEQVTFVQTFIGEPMSDCRFYENKPSNKH